MSELAQELIDLQAVCERLGVDDDDVLNRAADRITELETGERQLQHLVERLKNGIIHADIYGDRNISTGALTTLLRETECCWWCNGTSTGG